MERGEVAAGSPATLAQRAERLRGLARSSAPLTLYHRPLPPKPVNLRRQIGPNIATDFRPPPPSLPSPPFLSPPHPLAHSLPLPLSRSPTPRFTVRRFLHSSSNRYNIMLARTWPSLSMFSTCPHLDPRSTSPFFASSIRFAIFIFQHAFLFSTRWKLDGRIRVKRKETRSTRKGYFSHRNRYHKFRGNVSWKRRTEGEEGNNSRNCVQSWKDRARIRGIV